MIYMFKSAFLLSLILSLPAFGVEVPCPEAQVRYVDVKGIEVSYDKSSDLQFMVSVKLNPVYHGSALYSVTFIQGEWVYEKPGIEIASPELSVNLNVRDFDDRKLVQLFLGEEKTNRELLVQYGEHCSYVMRVNILVPNVSQ